jgi:hypothetical protein
MLNSKSKSKTTSSLESLRLLLLTLSEFDRVEIKREKGEFIITKKSNQRMVIATDALQGYNDMDDKSSS